MCSLCTPQCVLQPPFFQHLIVSPPISGFWAAGAFTIYIDTLQKGRRHECIAFVYMKDLFPKVIQHHITSIMCRAIMCHAHVYKIIHGNTSAQTWWPVRGPKGSCHSTGSWASRQIVKLVYTSRPTCSTFRKQRNQDNNPRPPTTLTATQKVELHEKAQGQGVEVALRTRGTMRSSGNH